MLSTLSLKSAKPHLRPYKLSDRQGLYLLVQPTGSKLWRYKFRIRGVEGKQSLGAFPDVSLAEARERHTESRKLVAQGINPVTARRQEEQSLKQADLERTKGIFSAVVTEWRAVTEASLRKITIKQRTREITNDLLPKLKNRSVKEITRLELTATLKDVEARAPEVARNLRGYLFGIFEHAIDSGLIDQNPAPPLRVLRRRRQTNHVALPDHRIGAFLEALETRAALTEQTWIAMLLLLLTACRKAEVIEARWAEFDLDRAQWAIPGERMKGSAPHWVPLSRQAMDLLKRLREISEPNRVHLFPNLRDPQKPMANRSLNAVIERLGFAKQATPHGMRATFSTHFNSINENPDVIELCLAHAPKDPVRAAYNRHRYRSERRVMLQQWADYLDCCRRGTQTLAQHAHFPEWGTPYRGSAFVIDAAVPAAAAASFFAVDACEL